MRTEDGQALAAAGGQGVRNVAARSRSAIRLTCSTTLDTLRCYNNYCMSLSLSVWSVFAQLRMPG